MRAFFHRTLPAILHHAAPEDSLPEIVHTLELEPRVIRIHGPAWEKMPDAFCTHNHVNTHRIPTPNRRRHPAERCRHRRGFAVVRRSGRSLSFLTHCERRGQFMLLPRLHLRFLFFVFSPAADSAKTSTVRAPLVKKSSVLFNCSASSFAVGTAVFAPGKRCE